MIDEELYQRAADELNSEHRRPHIWARACALANDDHDEARYLYTNLRVEELLAERAERPEASAASYTVSDDDLALEPLDFPVADDGEDVDAVPASRRAGLDGGAAEPLAPSAAEGERPASERGTLTLELDENRPFELDPTEVARENDAQHEPISAIDGRRVTLAELPAVGVGPDPAAAADGDADGDADDERARRDAADEVDLGDVPARGPSSPTAGGEPNGDAGEAGAPDAPHEDGPAAAGARKTLVLPPPDDVPGERRSRGDVVDIGHDPRGGEDATDASGGDTLGDHVRRSGDGDGERAARAAADDDDPLDSFFAEVSARGERSGAAPATAGADDTGGGLDELSWLDEGFRDERHAPFASMEDDPADRDADVANGRRAAPPHAGGAPAAATGADPTTEALAREFERQADELPVGRDEAAVIAHEPRRAGRLGAGGTAVGIGEEGVRANVGAGEGEPLELSEGDAREEFAVFTRRGSSAQTVRQGSSWGALFATLPWLLYRHLVGTAIVYALFALTVLAGLAASGFAWLDAGAAASPATRVAFGVFAALAVVGLLVVPFRRANHWREDKLERRGFELVAYVRADSAARAREIAERAVGAPR